MTDEFPTMTPAESVRFMLTMPWVMGDVTDKGATYSESEIWTVLDYVRQINERAKAAEAAVAELRAELADLRAALADAQKQASDWRKVAKFGYVMRDWKNFDA